MKRLVSAIKRFFTKPGEVKKAWATIIAIAAYIVNNNVLHGSALRWVTLAIGVAETVAVFKLPNDTATTSPAQDGPLY